jgi:hypothetical protein
MTTATHRRKNFGRYRFRFSLFPMRARRVA